MSALIVTEVCSPLNVHHALYICRPCLLPLVLSTFILQQYLIAIPILYCLCVFACTVTDWLFEGWSELTTVCIQKYAKSCYKTTWAVILITSIHLQEASGAPAFTLHQGGWITVPKRRFFLKERRSAVYKTL